ncbi:hypothetical protein Vi05172_g348 [Venturia inaequalis]|nr:hypothetical protein Vi05172_g348 [Venturia inaequalis]
MLLACTAFAAASVPRGLHDRKRECCHGWIVAAILLTTVRARGIQALGIDIPEVDGL